MAEILLTDLREYKSMSDIDQDDSSQDKKLLFLIEQASDWILNWLNRPEILYKQRTEYYDGRGTQQLLLRARPVFCDTQNGGTRGITVYVDETGGYGQIPGTFQNAQGAMPLTFGQDYYLKVDDGLGISSRSGILVKNNSIWHKNRVRYGGQLTTLLAKAYGTIQVTYWGGVTADTMPSAFRFSCVTLVQRMNFILPIGFQLSSDSYQEKSISILAGEKNYLMGLVTPLLVAHRNWSFSV